MENNKIGSIQNVKDRIINNMLVFFAVLTVPMVISSVSRSTVTGWNTIYTVQCFLGAAYVLFSIFRKRFKLYLKTVFLLVVILILCYSALTFLGFLGNGKMFFIMTAIFASLMLGRKYGIGMILVIVVSLIVYGYLYINGILKYSYDVNEFIARPSVWISYVISILVVISSVLLIINQFEDAYLSLLKQSTKSETYYRILFEQAAEGIMISDWKGDIEVVNESFKRITGYDDEEMRGLTFTELFAPNCNIADVMQLDTMQTGEIVAREMDILIKSGAKCIVDIRSQKLPDGRMQSFIRDITEHKRIEKEIEAERAFTNAVIESMPGLFYVIDDTGSIIKWNRTLEIESGYSSNEIMEKSPIDFFPEYEKAVIARTVDAESTDMGYSSQDAMFVRKDGTMKPYLFTGIPFKRNGKGYFCGVGLNISTLKETQRQLEDEKHFTESLLKGLPGIFYVFEGFDKLVQWNKNLENITGFTNDELYLKHPFDFFSAKDKWVIKNAIQNVQRTGFAYFQAELIAQNGLAIPHMQTGIAFEREGKKYFMGIGFDITDLVHAEKALKESEEKFRNIFNSTSDAIVIYDSEFTILSGNESFAQMTGLGRSDLRTVKMLDIVYEKEVRSKFEEKMHELQNETVSVAEMMVLNKEGKIFPIEIRSRLISYGGKVCVLASMNDISERKRLEKEIYVSTIKAEETERGRIAKDLHDGLGPLISTCKIYLHNIKKARFNEDEVEAYNKLGMLINESLSGIKEISNNLSPHILRNFGMIYAIRSFIEKISGGVSTNIQFHCPVNNRYNEIIEITLYRVVIELLNNTLKYAESSNISISLIEAANKLILSYGDDGIGFNYEKIMKKNIGLGLFNIHSRINSIGGAIDFYSMPGKGVDVKIEINLNT